MRNRFPVTLWLTLVALVAALALPARANTWPLPPPGSRLVGQNQFHVVQDDAVRWKRLPRSTMSASWPCCRPIPGLTPMFRAPAAC